MDDLTRHEIGMYFAHEARQMPPGVSERVLGRLEEAAADPGGRARGAPRWLAAVASVILAVCAVGALVLASVVSRQQEAGQPGGAPAGPPPRAGAAVAYDGADGTVVLFGGSANQAVLGDTWTWGSEGWTRIHPASAPPGRRDALAAYDEARRVVVLFGGSGSGARPALTDTWTWDGRSWTSHRTPVAPPTGIGMSMVYDPATRSVLLVTDVKGGTDSLWRWDGSSWTRLSADPPPVAGTLSYDGRRVLLTGGTGGSPAQETWAWDGRAWSQLSPALPLPSLAVAGTAFDRPRARALMLMKGPAGTETWTWDGATWARLHPAHEPPLGQDGWLTAGAGGPVWFDGTRIWTWDGRDWHAVTNGGEHR